MQKRIREKSRFNLNSISPSLANPIATTGITGGFSTLSSIGKRIIAVLLGLLIISSGLFVYNMQSAQAANAGAFEDWTCDNFKNGIYKDYGWGTTATLPSPSVSDLINITGDTDKTRILTGYEIYGTSGFTFTMWRSVDRENLDANQKFQYTPADSSAIVTLEAPKTSPYWANDFMECTGATGFLGNGIATVLISLTGMGVTIINFVYGVAVDSTSIVQPFYDEIDSIIQALQDSLYTPFITLIIMLGALWMAWVGLVKKRSTEAFQGALWMIGAAITGAILFLNPSFIPNTANSIVSAFTSSLSATITNNSTSSMNKDLCEVGEYSSTTGNNGANITVSKDSRIMQCAIWYNIVYTPWVVGQFGASPNGTTNKDKAIIGGGGEAGTNGLTTETVAMLDKININLGYDNKLSNSQKTWPIVQLNVQALNDNVRSAGTSGGQYNYGDSSATSAEQFNYVAGSVSAVAYQQLVVNSYGSTWKGTDAWSRVSIASTSNIAMIATGIIVIMFGGMIMMYEFATIFLVLIMPIFLLIGMHPGFGRRVALRWLEMLANFTIKRILATILLSLFIMFYAIIMNMQTNWLSQNLLIIIVTIVGLKYKGSIMNAFANVDFGGDKNALTPDAKGGSSMGKKLLGAAVGATAATLGANSILKTLAPAAAAAGSDPVIPTPVGGAGPTLEPTPTPTPGGGGNGPTPTPTPGGSGGNGPTPTPTPTPTPGGGGNAPTPPPITPETLPEGTTDTTLPLPAPVPVPTPNTSYGPKPVSTPKPVKKPTTGPAYGPKPTAKNDPKAKIDPNALPPRTSEESEKQRIEDLKKSTVRKAAMQGALQGFSGNMQSAVLGASLTGMQMGDNIHDNEINRQENEKRDKRDQERTALMREQMDNASASQTRVANLEEARFSREQERMYYEAGVENARWDQAKLDLENAESDTPYERTDNWTPVDEEPTEPYDNGSNSNSYVDDDDDRFNYSDYNSDGDTVDYSNYRSPNDPFEAPNTTNNGSNDFNNGANTTFEKPQTRDNSSRSDVPPLRNDNANRVEPAPQNSSPERYGNQTQENNSNRVIPVQTNGPARTELPNRTEPAPRTELPNRNNSSNRTTPAPKAELPTRTELPRESTPRNPSENSNRNNSSQAANTPPVAPIVQGNRKENEVKPHDSKPTTPNVAPRTRETPNVTPKAPTSPTVAPKVTPKAPTPKPNSDPFKAPKSSNDPFNNSKPNKL